MKKKLFLLGTIITFSFLITGCSSKGTAFKATVVEKTENSLLVEPLTDEKELQLPVQISIPKSEVENLEITEGDIIEIVYNNVILETLPAKLEEIYSIKLSSE